MEVYLVLKGFIASNAYPVKCWFGLQNRYWQHLVC
jgi:hypothetical protein